MHPPQMIRDAGRTLIVALTAVLALALPACADREKIATCGDSAEPPIALDRAACDAGAPGARWYSWYADDLAEADEQPVIGQPLDGDWWDPDEQYDTSDSHKSHKKATTTKDPKKSDKSATKSAPSSAGRK